MQAEKISLYYKDAASDKEYHAQLTAEGDGFIVTFQYGRRHGTLTAGKKTANPVAYPVAKKAYDKLVTEKVGKGYSPGAAGAAFENTALEQRFTGIVPQLLNPISEEETEAYFTDPAFVAQQKYNGHRRLIKRDAAGRVGINRKGLAVSLPETVGSALDALAEFGDLVLDGELMGSVYAIFDVLELEGQDLRPQPYQVRLAALARIGQALASAGVTDVFAVKTASSEAEKRALHEEMRALKREGTVFKRADAPYVAGRPNSKGNQLKRVFRHSATLVVTQPHASKRSVSVHAFDGAGKNVPLGNVTIPANQVIPAKGALVEVTYMHVFVGGSLYQPQYQGERDDIELAACTTAQLLFYTPEAGAEEEEDEIPSP